MNVADRAKAILEKTGRKQKWVADQMAALAPTLEMTPSKLSQTLTGKRTMTADELVVFCKVTGADLAAFLAESA